MTTPANRLHVATGRSFAEDGSAPGKSGGTNHLDNSAVEVDPPSVVEQAADQPSRDRPVRELDQGVDSSADDPRAGPTSLDGSSSEETMRRDSTGDQKTAKGNVRGAPTREELASLLRNAVEALERNAQELAGLRLEIGALSTRLQAEHGIGEPEFKIQVEEPAPTSPSSRPRTPGDRRRVEDVPPVSGGAQELDGFVRSVADSFSLRAPSQSRSDQLHVLGTGRLAGHPDWVNAVAFSPDGSLLATGSDDQTVQVWGVASGKRLLVLAGHSGPVEAVAFSPLRRNIASASDDGTIRIWDIDTGGHLRTLAGHNGDVLSLGFTPGGSVLANGSIDSTIVLWDPDAGTRLDCLRGHKSGVNALVFGADDLLVSASEDCSVRVWNSFRAGSTGLQIGDASMVSVALNPDASLVASGSFDGRVHVWSTKGGKHVVTLEATDGAISPVAFSVDGRFLIRGVGDAPFEIFRTDTWQLVQTLANDVGNPWSLTFSPGGRLAAGGDRNVRLWDLA